MQRRVALAVECTAFALMAAVASWRVWRSARSTHAVAVAGYVDAQTCVSCHREEAAGYAATGMAKAFSLPNAVLRTAGDGTAHNVYHSASNSFYRIYAHDGQWWQRRWQKGFDGREDNVDELSIDYVMGSGNHARTFLHRERDGTLIELPLAWYAEGGGQWAMNPGFDNAAPNTRRAIAYECMFCHNAYPQIPDAEHRDLSAKPVYAGALPAGIDCQRCHGPGAAHVRAAQTPGTALAQVRASILNPASLSNARQMEVCEQCHLETTSTLLPDRIRRYDRQPFSYDPREPLSAFNAYFSRDASAGNTNNFEIVSAPYRLRQSKCFLATQGALTCEKCHDPHDLHKGPQSAGYYARICLSCHTDTLRAMVAERRHTASTECVGCHMPQRRTEDVVHAVMTDHLIQRIAPSGSERLAPRQEATSRYAGPVRRYLLDSETLRPDETLYDALAQVIDKSDVPAGIPALAESLAKNPSAYTSPYVELGDAQRATGQTDAAIASYRRAVQADPRSSRAGRRLGVALNDAGQTTEARSVLDAAVADDPTNELLRYERAQVETRTGDLSSAAADLRRAVELRPDYAQALQNLGSLQARGGDAASAETDFRAALRVDPYSSDARANLARLLIAKGQDREAMFQFGRAAALSPHDADIRIDYAIALVQANRARDADVQLKAALEADPRSPRALDLAGQIALQRNALAEARALFEKSLACDPQFAPAWLDLGETLLALGDAAHARPWLERAQAEAPPPIARRAAELLRHAGAR